MLESDVKARRGELTADSLQLTASVGYGIRNAPERLAVSRKPIADSVETTMTADGLRPTLTAHDLGQSDDESHSVGSPQRSLSDRAAGSHIVPGDLT
jgi:hypothetical protein